MRTVIICEEQRIVATFEECDDQCGSLQCGGCTECLIQQAHYNGFRVVYAELGHDETPGDALGRIAQKPA